MTAKPPSDRRKPIEVKRGNVTVKNYSRANRVADKVYPQFTLVYDDGTHRKKLRFADLGELQTHEAFYVRQGALTCELRASYGRRDVQLYERDVNDDDDDDSPPTPPEMLQQLRFLVLDEIGRTALANDERLFRDELLKHRYDNGKETGTNKRSYESDSCPGGG